MKPGGFTWKPKGSTHRKVRHGFMEFTMQIGGEGTIFKTQLPNFDTFWLGRFIYFIYFMYFKQTCHNFLGHIGQKMVWHFFEFPPQKKQLQHFLGISCFGTTSLSGQWLVSQGPVSSHNRRLVFVVGNQGSKEILGNQFIACLIWIRFSSFYQGCNSSYPHKIFSTKAQQD